MKRGYIDAAVGVAVLAFGAGALADVVGVHKVFLPNDIKWHAAPASLPAGSEAAVLYGDPTKEGAFVLRIKTPKGYRIPPHSHPKAEVITIISGQIGLGLGPAADRASVEALPAGSLSTMPPGVVHYVFVEEETVVQVNGTGPWGVEYVDPRDDPRNQIAPAQR